jgi:hypothetical protein
VVAYGLIVLTVFAGIGIALALRYNSRAATMARDQKRQRQRNDARLLKK